MSGLNYVTINDQRTADRLRVPLGESVPWERAFPRWPIPVRPVECDCAACQKEDE